MAPRRVLVLLVSLLSVVWAPAATAQECPGDNLLQGLTPLHTQGVAEASIVTDGWLTAEGQAAGAPEATRIDAPGAHLIWDLGVERAIVAGAIQADNNDVYQISGSLDGKQYAPFWLVGAVEGAGLRERASNELQGRARFIRLDVGQNDGFASVSELRLYCQVPNPWPPAHMTRLSVVEPNDATEQAKAQGWKLLIGIGLVVLLLVGVPRLGDARHKRRVYAFSLAVSAFAWTQFGYFNGGPIVHFWDSMHYYMGSKYFPETGYFDLYRCGAQAEREHGREAEVDRMGIRDLDDNRIYPGEWSRTPAGKCRAQFTPERWQSFKDDLEAYRPLFTDRPLVNAFNDHGYNATPVHVAWLSLFTDRVPVSASNLSWLSQLDSLALIAAVGALWWGFGPVAACISAVTLAFAFPWSYSWTGGGLARLTWLAAACVGMAGLQRDRPLLGGAGLTAAALLRLFPALFVGALGIWILSRWKRRGALDDFGKRALIGIALTFAVGIGIGAGKYGVRSYGEFAKVVQRHSTTPLTNHLGLNTLLGAAPGELSTDLQDNRLTDPFEVWKSKHLLNRVHHRPFWVAAIAGGLVLILWAAWRGGTAAEVAALGGPLVFAAIPLTSYDYVWLVLLVPLCFRHPLRLAGLAGYALATQTLGVFHPNLEVRHVYYGVLLILALGLLIRELVRELQTREADAVSPAAD